MRQLPDNFDHETGLRLQAIRRHLQLKSEEMATSLEVSRGYLSELENSRAAPGPKFLSALRRVYGIREEFVLSGAGPMHEPSATDDDQPIDHSPAKPPNQGRKNREFLAQIEAVLPLCDDDIRDLLLRLANYGARSK